MKTRATGPTVVISVGASAKKAGKSTLAAHLVRELGAEYGLKVSSGGSHAPAGNIIDDTDIISQPGTDTGRLVEAGARRVLWVDSGGEELGRELEHALSRFPPGGTLVVEGNSALGHIEPDYAVFLMNSPFELFKPSALPALARADLVLVDTSDVLRGADPRTLEREIRERAPAASIIFYGGGEERECAWREVVRLIKKRGQAPV